MTEYSTSHFLIVIFGIVALVVLPFALVIYNKLVRARSQVRSAWADIEVQLKRRYDLVPNLLETVKGYASHEKDTLEGVIKARQQCVDISAVADKDVAEAALPGALRSVFAVAEAYSELKADTRFGELQGELTRTEKKVAYARRFYNDAVEQYNAAIELFPLVLFARQLGFSPAPFFGLGAAEEADAPKVTF